MEGRRENGSRGFMGWCSDFFSPIIVSRAVEVVVSKDLQLVHKYHGRNCGWRREIRSIPLRAGARRRRLKGRKDNLHYEITTGIVHGCAPIIHQL